MLCSGRKIEDNEVAFAFFFCSAPVWRGGASGYFVPVQSTGKGRSGASGTPYR